MQQGKIWVADHAGVYVIKMVGDVRLTLCMSFDQFIDAMFEADDFASIIFDLTSAEAIDSTTLGLMAKISILADQRKHLRPVIISTSAGINRLLDTMGFSEIFNIMTELPVPLSPDQCLEVCDMDECAARNKVLEAHRILMELNENNRETFKDLVKTLEDSN
ncbi:STAS domain-containing protein [Aestuariicella hydrocarbonica]|uniref:STAS domain-containing protein n=1 Tax=Pseudomaricurvus hydrocarbonicus TaxID=1470433 RepID=A0A9E5JTS1_9GAMM|nr:STAS domain-containing protein [Aestuariicella hydrocarbonica]NHO64720.1 STAS domain-containing protein [Aestuariicella hydrocarbonica]